VTLSVDVRHAQGAFRLEARFDSDAAVTALFGPSGSGKTTLVNLVAGLIRPTDGRILLDGEPLFDAARRIDVPVHRRRIGYVFQEARLFPHLSVRSNLGYGRRMAALAGRRGDGDEFDRVVALLGIAPLLARKPAGLSGGEAQRVAIGRALLARPRLLLMDEPLAALDAARKAEILPYLERVAAEARVPIVYVSHSVPEVVRLAGTVVALDHGRVVACGPASEVIGGLDTTGLAGADDAGAVLEAIVDGDEPDGLTRLATPAGRLVVPALGRPAGARLRLLVRARDVLVAAERPHGLSALNVLPATVAAIGPPHGAAVDVSLSAGTAVLHARLTRRAVAELALAPGKPCFAIVKASALADDGGPPAPTTGAADA
jgi:molybdate transport system ATP-binding protein